MKIKALLPVILRPLAPFDPDTRDYIRRVEAVDGQPLERGVRQSLDAFVRGCKADGIWDAIKASCIMAGARTLAGALVPLKGAAPTNFNFVSGDYNRKTGLVGDGSTKYLDSGRNNNADPQNSQHMCVYTTTAGSAGIRMYIGAGGSTGSSGASHFNINSNAMDQRNRSSGSGQQPSLGTAIGLLGMSRSSSSTFNYRYGGSVGTVSRTSQSSFAQNIQVFANEANYFNDARLAYYSIGESLDLALLDARVTTLINNISDALTWGWAMTITIADTTHTLRLNAACTFVVDWGDGTRETLTSTTAWTYTKTYAAPGTYRLRFSIQSGTFWPYYDNFTADVAELRTLEGTGPEAWSFGANLLNAFYGASGLTEVSEGMNTAGVTNFFRTWQSCSSLTSFPLLDVSSGTSFTYAWFGCTSLTSFPLLDVSSGLAFIGTWQQCSSLTSFPLLNVSSGTNFQAAWYQCTSLTSFPANFFDVTGTLVSTAFTNAFFGCALTAASIENILTSLVTNGQSNITLTLSGGTNAGAATWTPAAIAAYDTLISRGWTISRNA